MPDISIVNVVKSFEEDKNILDGFSLDVLEGERVGLLGRNGAGKTTLFRLITGEIEPDEGQIAIPAEKRVGLISQIPRFPSDWTAEDVLKSAHKRFYDMRERLDFSLPPCPERRDAGFCGRLPLCGSIFEIENVPQS